MRYYYDETGTVRYKVNVRGSLIQPSIDLPWIDDSRNLDESKVTVDTQTLELRITNAE